MTSVFNRLFIGICLVWACFQLWLASPLPYIFNWAVFNSTEARMIHLAFATLLVFLSSILASKNSIITFSSILFAIVSVYTCLYGYIYYEEISQTMGMPSRTDIIVGVLGLLILLVAAKKSLGWPLVLVSLIFLTYSLAGPYMPDIVSHKGVSVAKLISHQWLTTEGVFGIAVGVSTAFVFLFVLFGSLLEKAGAGSYFIKLAFSVLGHYRGGPAKAAVLASGLTGLASGSSIANVVTTGTFTIPLMKRVGFSPSKAAAIEVAASTNGQLTPPVMGAAAFLMVEYVGISYIDLIKHALLPALISYVALIYIVHLEAIKADLAPLKKQKSSFNFLEKTLRFILGFLIVAILYIGFHYSFSFIKEAYPSLTSSFALLFLIIFYIIAVKISSKNPTRTLESFIESDPPQLPTFIATLLSGMHYLLPVIVLVWCLAVEQLSPATSAFWGTCSLVVLLLTQKPLLQYFSNEKEPLFSRFIEGGKDLVEGLISGSTNMMGIAIATAAAGIIVGTVTQTGIGLVMVEFIELISGGNLIVALLFTAIICLVLGMGLPTTANYIVVSTLMAPVLVTLGAQSDLIIPLIAVHLFVFYFGILADDTPPVCLAAYAAAGIAKSDPMKTGVQGFMYDIRTAILPFMFLFNTEILLIGVESLWHLILVVISTGIAMLLFCSVTQGYFIRKNKWWEGLVILLISFSFFRLDYIQEQFSPRYSEINALQTSEENNVAKAGLYKLTFTGENFEGDVERKTVEMKVINKSFFDTLYNEFGLQLNNNSLEVENVEFGSVAEKLEITYGWSLKNTYKENQRISKYWLMLPLLILIFLIYLTQTRSDRKIEKFIEPSESAYE